MKEHFWFSSIRKTTIEFLNIFRNIQVAKYDENGDFHSYVTLPIKNANKDKFYIWLNDRRHEKRFPMLAVYMNGLSLDQSRLGNKQFESYFSTTSPSGDKTLTKYYNISPWNISYSVEIVSLFQIEMDQILEQILGFFDPAIYIKVLVPEIDNILNIKVLYRGSTPNTNPQIDANDYRHISWTLNFEAQGYLFKPTAPVPIVTQINTTTYTALSPSADNELIMTTKDGMVIQGPNL